MLAGGVFGYTKSHSSKSLIAGIVSAIILSAAFFVSRQQPRMGLGAGAAVAIGLVVVFVIRIQEVQAQTPPGSPASNIALAALSGLVALFLLYAVSQARA